MAKSSADAQQVIESTSRIWEPLPLGKACPAKLAAPVLRCIYELQFVGRTLLIPAKENGQSELVWKPVDDGRRSRFESVPALAILAELYNPAGGNKGLIDNLRTAIRYLSQKGFIDERNPFGGEAEVRKGMPLPVESAMGNYVRHDGLFVMHSHSFPPIAVTDVVDAKWLHGIETEKSLRAKLALGERNSITVDSINVSHKPIYWVLRRYPAMTDEFIPEPALRYTLGYPASLSSVPPDENFVITDKGIELVEGAGAGSGNPDTEREKWLPASYYKQHYSISDNRLRNSAIAGRINKKKNANGTRNLYHVDDVRREWPGLFESPTMRPKAR